MTNFLWELGKNFQRVCVVCVTCVWVCVCVGVCVCVRACVGVRARVCGGVCVSVRAWARVCARVRVRVCFFLIGFNVMHLFGFRCVREAVAKSDCQPRRVCPFFRLSVWKSATPNRWLSVQFHT